jgi:hypothetical protein
MFVKLVDEMMIGLDPFDEDTRTYLNEIAFENQVSIYRVVFDLIYCKNGPWSWCTN